MPTDSTINAVGYKTVCVRTCGYRKQQSSTGRWHKTSCMLYLKEKHFRKARLDTMCVGASSRCSFNTVFVDTQQKRLEEGKTGQFYILWNDICTPATRRLQSSFETLLFWMDGKCSAWNNSYGEAEKVYYHINVWVDHGCMGVYSNGSSCEDL